MLQEYYELDDLTGDVIRPNVNQFRKCCKPTHAWALTIHKFQGPVANVMKLFWRNYVAIGITSVKIIGKYAASGVNNALKSFIILATAL